MPVTDKQRIHVSMVTSSTIIIISLNNQAILFVSFSVFRAYRTILAKSSQYLSETISHHTKQRTSNNAFANVETTKRMSTRSRQPHKLKLMPLKLTTIFPANGNAHSAREIKSMRKNYRISETHEQRATKKNQSYRPNAERKNTLHMSRN